MKQIEPRDLETGKEYIVAFLNEENMFIPCTVKVVKEYTVKLVRPTNVNFSPLESNREYLVSDFYHESRGYDLFGQKFRLINYWDNMREALRCCVEFNKMRMS